MSKPSLYWFRLCVDTDTAGNVKGASYEVHDDERTVSVVVLPVAPFDGADDALRSLVDHVEAAYGVHLSML